MPIDTMLNITLDSLNTIQGMLLLLFLSLLTICVIFFTIYFKIKG